MRVQSGLSPLRTRLQPRRTASTLAGQAEWQTRLLTAAAGQMAAETARCEHAMLRAARPARIGAGI
jgi:hypothetical protein